MNTKIFRRFSYLLCLFLPYAVNATLWSAGKVLLSSTLISSTLMTQGVTSQTCFQNGIELKNAVDDYLGADIYASSLYGSPIDTWCVKHVTDMRYMFYNEKDFNEDISEWDVSSVTDMEAMFYNASAFNQDISNWNVSSVINMHYMFYNASAFNQNLCPWREKLNNSTHVKNMFLSTQCPYKGHPDLRSDLPSSFCADCDVLPAPFSIFLLEEKFLILILYLLGPFICIGGFSIKERFLAGKEYPM